MTNLNSLNPKSIEKNYSVQPPSEELDKLNNKSVPENNDIPPIVLILFSIIPMVILLILFTFF